MPSAAMNPSGGQNDFFALANSGSTLPLSPNADPRGAPAPLIANTPVGGGKGGGVLGQLMPRPTQGQFAPLAPQGQFNVNQAAAGGLQQAMMGTQAGMGFQPIMTRAIGYNPAQASRYISQYQNPYESQVVQSVLTDLGGAQQQSLNQLGAEATQARAFGGSRHGIAEAETRKSYAQQAADAAAQMRQQGFNTALGAAQAQAAAQTAANQFGATAGMNVQQQNFANQLAALGARQGAASQLGGLASQAFQTGQTIQQQQAQQGLLQQGLQQALIDAARGQYAGYTGAPQAALGAPLAALGATTVPQSTTETKDPGLFSYLQLAAGLPGVSDARLKKNVTAKGKIGNVNFYTWDWNDAGKKIADPAQPTFGVIADELQKTHPHLVARGNDGYLRVNYAGLASDLENAA